MRIKNKQAVISAMMQEGLSLSRDRSKVDGKEFARMSVRSLCAVMAAAGKEVSASDAWDMLSRRFGVLPGVFLFMSMNGLSFGLSELRKLRDMAFALSDNPERELRAMQATVLDLCGRDWLDIHVADQFAVSDPAVPVVTVPVRVNGNVDMLVQAGRLCDLAVIVGNPGDAAGEFVFDPCVIEEVSRPFDEIVALNKDTLRGMDAVCHRAGLSMRVSGSLPGLEDILPGGSGDVMAYMTEYPGMSGQMSLARTVVMSALPAVMDGHYTAFDPFARTAVVTLTAARDGYSRRKSWVMEFPSDRLEAVLRDLEHDLAFAYLDFTELSDIRYRLLEKYDGAMVSSRIRWDFGCDGGTVHGNREKAADALAASATSMAGRLVPVSGVLSGDGREETEGKLLVLVDTAGTREVVFEDDPTRGVLTPLWPVIVTRPDDDSEYGFLSEEEIAEAGPDGFRIRGEQALYQVDSK